MKHIVTTILILITFQSFGQFTKGDKVLGGTLSFNAQRAKDSPDGGLINKATSFSITPNVGILLNESWELGLQVGYSSTEYERNTTTPIISNWGSRAMTVGLYTQKYFVITDKFFFSVIGNMRYGFGKRFDKTTNTDTDEVTESEDKESSIGVNVRPNFIFFPSTHWAIQASIGNINYTYSNNDDQPLHLFNVNYGTINLGLSYYFRKEVKE